MLFVELIVKGLAYGCMYAMMAVGLTLVYGLLRILHIAHAGVFALGAYMVVTVANATGSLALQKKVGLGAQAWVMQGTVRGGYKAARFGADEGFSTAAELQLAKRVLPNLRLAANAKWLEHDAQSAVFDLNQSTYGIEAQWDINDRWTLAGSAGWLQGDIVANAAWPVWQQMLDGAFGPAIHSYYTSRPWSVTNLYGPRWVSYNVEADVDLWSLTLTYTFADHAALDLGYSSAYVVNEVGVTYPGNSWSARLNYRF